LTKTLRTLTSTQVDPLTDEQILKRAIGVEDVDQRGLVKRHRALDQTLFDKMFILELINQTQHEAAHLFMDAISKSGATVRSANLDVEVFTAHRDVGNMIGERRMAFSSAYRRLVEDCGNEDANRLVGFFSGLHSSLLDKAKAPGIALWVRPCLNALARFYGCEGIQDARIVLRMYRKGRGERV